MNRPVKRPEVFEIMCYRDVSHDPYTKLVSIPQLAERLGTSQYQVRKTMKSLVESGDVVSGMESCCDEYTDQYYIVRGFLVTPKGRESEMWKSIHREEMKLINDIFGTKDP